MSMEVYHVSGTINKDRNTAGAIIGKGIKGDKGDNGTTFIPSVSEDGTISWTNDGDLPNPDPVDIKGPKGDKGDTGDTGPKGDKGDTGTGVPEVTAADDGKFLRVVGGVWEAVTVPEAGGEEF